MDEISKLLMEHGGVAGFGALFVLKVGDMVWRYFREREKVTDNSLHELKCALEKQTAQMTALDADIKKLKTDLNRCFFAVKELSGDQWLKIASRIRNPDSSDNIPS